MNFFLQEEAVFSGRNVEFEMIVTAQFDVTLIVLSYSVIRGHQIGLFHSFAKCRRVEEF